MSFQVPSSTHIIWNYQELTGLVRGKVVLFCFQSSNWAVTQLDTHIAAGKKKEKKEERSTMLSSSSSIISSHNHHFDYSGTVMCNPWVSMSPNLWAFSYWKVLLESFNMHKDLTVCLVSFNMHKDLTMCLESFNMHKNLTRRQDRYWWTCTSVDNELKNGPSPHLERESNPQWTTSTTF